MREEFFIQAGKNVFNGFDISGLLKSNGLIYA